MYYYYECLIYQRDGFYSSTLWKTWKSTHHLHFCCHHDIVIIDVLKIKKNTSTTASTSIHLTTTKYGTHSSQLALGTSTLLSFAKCALVFSLLLITYVPVSCTQLSWLYLHQLYIPTFLRACYLYTCIMYTGIITSYL